MLWRGKDEEMVEECVSAFWQRYTGIIRVP